MLQYSDQPLHYYRSFYVPLGRVAQRCRMGYRTLIRALAHEPDVHAYCYAHPVRFTFWVPARHVPEIVAKYGSPEAIAARRARICAQPNGPPLEQPCPKCAKKGKQWRMGRTKAGKQSVRCGHCRRNYVIGARPPIRTQCKYCGTREDQIREKRRPGALEVRCKWCERYYTVRPDPDAIPT